MIVFGCDLGLACFSVPGSYIGCARCWLPSVRNNVWRVCVCVRARACACVGVSVCVYLR